MRSAELDARLGAGESFAVRAAGEVRASCKLARRSGATRPDCLRSSHALSSEDDLTVSAPTARAPVPDPGPAASRAIAGFIARFVGGWVVVIALVTWVPALERWAVGHTVASLAQLARLLRLPFSATGSSIQIADAGMQIVPDCTPLMPIAALAIAVLAFPAAWRWRLGGLAVGAVALWLYNLARIFALVPVLIYRPEWFEFIHVYLWQTMTLLVVFGLFLLWLRLQRSRPPAGAAPATGAGAAAGSGSS